MALPVLCGPNRCALVYNQDRQPLIELSLQVNLPVVELLHALSQVAPRDTESEPSRPSLAPQRGITTPSYGTKSTTAWKQEGPLYTKSIKLFICGSVKFHSTAVCIRKASASVLGWSTEYGKLPVTHGHFFQPRMDQLEEL